MNTIKKKTIRKAFSCSAVKCWTIIAFELISESLHKKVCLLFVDNTYTEWINNVLYSIPSQYAKPFKSYPFNVNGDTFVIESHRCKITLQTWDTFWTKSLIIIIHSIHMLYIMHYVFCRCMSQNITINIDLKTNNIII